jgi:hypothetical protein
MQSYANTTAYDGLIEAVETLNVDGIKVLLSQFIFEEDFLQKLASHADNLNRSDIAGLLMPK